MILTREPSVIQLKDHLSPRDKEAIVNLIAYLETVPRMISSLQKQKTQDRNDAINGFFDECVDPIADKLWNTALAEYTAIQFAYTFYISAFYTRNGVYDSVEDENVITLDELRNLVRQ